MGTPVDLNDITFKKTNGGLGRIAESDDVISGLIFGGLGLTVASDISPTDSNYSFEAIDDAGTYVRKFTYPEELAKTGIVYTPKPENDVLTAPQKAMNVLYYHITEFFRMNPKGVLYVMVKDGNNAVTTTTTSQGVTTDGDIIKLQTFAGGNIRQIGVFNSTCTSTFINGMQVDCKTLEDKHQPLSVVLTFSGRTASDPVDISTLTGYTPGNNEPAPCNVSLLIGCDMDTGLQNDLDNFAFYGCIGLCIGAISKAKVHECIAWVGNFALGLKVPALFNGNHIRNISTTELKTLNGNRYIFPVIHAGDADNYFNDSHTLDDPTSDYAYIENVRTIDKACRGIRSKLLPWLNSPLRVDPSSGHLEAGTVKFLETTAGEALVEMEKAGEISGYKVEIDPAQNVLATSKVEIVVKKVPMGVMRKVEVEIGYTTAL
ncbi:MAG: DUF2586 domain-containing protein [Bacteroidales bacterium]|nr:DUF2586 domain-containing protein [Bacteroidales bacterium]